MFVMWCNSNLYRNWRARCTIENGWSIIVAIQIVSSGVGCNRKLGSILRI
jgi:hypothetical protein